MDRLNLILMGKTGAGKSTLVNAVMGENVAPVKKVTRESKIYSKKMMIPMVSGTEDGQFSMVAKTVCLYDTVGLEFVETITEKTLQDIQGLIRQAQGTEKERDITLVWFCVNYRFGRFEEYEVELIRKLSIEYEIPFVMVVTQCLSEEKEELERQIEEDFPELLMVRILAQDYRTRAGVIPAFGTEELLNRSIRDYDRSKVHILKEKLDKLFQQRQDFIQGLRDRGEEHIAAYSKKAKKIGRLPIGCIPFVHRLCVKMISKLNGLVGIDSSSKLAEDIFVGVLVGVVATPLMAVPIISAAAATSYIEAVGKNYLDALMEVVEGASTAELKDNDLMAKRIQEELKKGGHESERVHECRKNENG